MKIKTIMIASALISTSLTAFASPSAHDFQRTTQQITKDCDANITTFNQRIDTMTKVRSAATYQTVMEPFDNYMLEFARGFMLDYLMQNVHTEESIRKAAGECIIKELGLFNSLGMNRPLYERISVVNKQGLSPEQLHTLNYWKYQFEASGISKDVAVRKKIKNINDDITAVEQTFAQNITDDVRTIKVKPARLIGVPQDYLDSHPPGEDGLMTITTAYSDTGPIYKYAQDSDLRKQVMTMSYLRGYPQNKEILEQVISKKYQLAQLLDHDNFAQLNMLGTMVATPENAQQFTTKLSAAIKAPVKAEKQRILSRAQQQDSKVTLVNPWDVSYYSNKIRVEDYKLDAKLVRQYFDYDKVRNGILKLSEDLFSLKITPFKGATWHKSVEAYEVSENGKVIGRFYFDSHPREGKYTHAAQFGIKLGKKDVEIPEAALLMNFPKGLMEHGQVETFLHEFGHLLHFIFAGQNDIGFSRFQDESDFGEAPSMMLQEWVWDYDTVAKFASNDKGEVIPKDLFNKMAKARYFGQAIGTANQLTYTAMSLNLYNQNPKNIELNSFEDTIYKNYSPFGKIKDTYMYTSFGHLTGYGAKYYTYQWSNAIAEELLSRFKAEGLRNKKTANDYRNIILSRTGTQPAAELVKEFLKRDFSVDAYAERLSKTE